jgi:hypothetical protein
VGKWSDFKNSSSSCSSSSSYTAASISTAESATNIDNNDNHSGSSTKSSDAGLLNSEKSQSVMPVVVRARRNSGGAHLHKLPKHVVYNVLEFMVSYFIVSETRTLYDALIKVILALNSIDSYIIFPNF